MRIITSAVICGAIWCLFFSQSDAQEEQSQGVNATSQLEDDEHTSSEINSTLSADNSTSLQPEGDPAESVDQEPGQPASGDDAAHLSRTQPLHAAPGDEELEATQAPNEGEEERPSEEHAPEDSQGSPPADREEQYETHEGEHDPDQAARDAEYQMRVRAHEEAMRRYEEERRQAEEDDRRRHEGEQDPRDPVSGSERREPETHHSSPHHVQPAETGEELPPTESIQATFKFISEKRCFEFLRRLKSKGQNKHSHHPLTCPMAFDGILCWRPADPGETLKQVCPDVPRQHMSFAKRECGTDGQWKAYPNANRKLHLHEILHTTYEDCYNVPAFLRKHGAVGHETDDFRPAPTTIPDQLDPSATRLLGIVTQPMMVDVPGPTDASATASTDQSTAQDEAVLYASDADCQDYLAKNYLLDTRNGTWCSGLSDGQHCWPATQPSTNISQLCRNPLPDEDKAKIPRVYRFCGANGVWNSVATSGLTGDPTGWTNREACNAPTNGNLVVAGGPFMVVDGETTQAPQAEPVQGATLALTAVDAARWLLRTPADCEKFLKEIKAWDETAAGSCRGGTDGTICWPTTPKSTPRTLPCPNIAGLDPSKNISRLCGSNGVWAETAGTYRAHCVKDELRALIDCPPVAASSATKTIMEILPFFLASLVVKLL